MTVTNLQTHFVVLDFAVLLQFIYFKHYEDNNNNNKKLKKKTDVPLGHFKYPIKNFGKASLSVWRLKGWNGAATVCVDHIETVKQLHVQEEMRRTRILLKSLISWFKSTG